MRAAVLQQMGEPLAVVELPDPTPEVDEVVLRVDACGICGSDLHLSDAWPLPGLVMGHEFCGTVVALGAGVGGLREGDRVVALSLETCGACGACLTGRPRKCAKAREVGIQRPGGYAQFTAVTARDVVPLPDSVDDRMGALIEPLAVALHSVDRAGIESGDDVLVIGAGPIGQAVTLWLQHRGAGHVVVSDPVTHRRELATQVGATATVDPTATPLAEAFADLTGAPPQVVIECVGVPGMIQHATDMAAVDARVVIAGVCMAPDTIQPLTSILKELDLRFSLYYRTKDYDHTIAMIDEGRIDPSPLVTDEIGLDEVPARFQALKSPSTECKVLIRP